MAGFRNIDAFVKPRHDLVSKSAIGGLITVIAATSAAILFVAEIYLYFQGMTRHSLHLTQSKSAPMLPPNRFFSSSDNHLQNYQKNLSKIPLSVLVTFPYLSCTQLDFTLNGVSHSSGKLETTHGDEQFVRLRTPTSSELKKATSGIPKLKNIKSTGCTIQGNFKIPIVAGEFSITITRRTWSEATAQVLLGMVDGGMLIPGANSMHGFNINMSHYIHHVRFGQSHSFAPIENPLEDRLQNIENRFGGIALQQVAVRLIPTIYQKFLTEQTSYQLSVVDHTVDPETLLEEGIPLYPGLVVNYDFSPLAVHHVEMRDNILVFLSTLVSIVGGVFITVGLVAGCFLNSAAAVAKKLD